MHERGRLARRPGPSDEVRRPRSDRSSIAIALKPSRPPATGHTFGNLRVSAPTDVREQAADQLGEQVLHGTASGATPTPDVASPDGDTEGTPLAPTVRGFMEPRFGADFSAVRAHTDSVAARACELLGARAFTHRRHIFFGRDTRPANDALTAHELAHVVQNGSDRGHSVETSSAGADIQRKLELRPPGKGEASAFDRAQELVDRLNTVSPAIQYQLKGNSLEYVEKDPAALTHFDKVMKGFIDRGELVAMRLISHKGYVDGGPLFADSFILAYVDIDDLLADDIYSFQSDILHFLTERFQVRDYTRRIGTNMSAEFPRAHRAGKDAEAAQLQSLFNDASIVFVYEELKPNNTWVNAFKSRTNGFWVFQVVRHSNREVAGGEMWVQKRDGTRVSMDDFRKERAAAAP